MRIKDRLIKSIQRAEYVLWDGQEVRRYTVAKDSKNRSAPLISLFFTDANDAESEDILVEFLDTAIIPDFGQIEYTDNEERRHILEFYMLESVEV